MGARRYKSWWRCMLNLVLRRQPHWLLDSAETSAMVSDWHKRHPGFNQPVVIPMCTAKKLLIMAQAYRDGEAPALIPCYAAEEEETIQELANYIKECTKHAYIWD
jgi:hypothetical protein